MRTDGPLFQSKSEYAYATVKQRILSEDLPPGAVINQQHVATEIGVSTTPLREALRRLATEGLVLLGSHRDARVSELSAMEARSVYEVRHNLDPLAARLAAERRTPDDIATLDAASQRLRPLSGQADWDGLVAHRAFHRAVYRAAHNQPLFDVLEGLWDQADRYRQVELRTRPRTTADIARVQTEHDALAEAVRARRGDAAEDVMRRHVESDLGRHAVHDLADREARNARRPPHAPEDDLPVS